MGQIRVNHLGGPKRRKRKKGGPKCQCQSSETCHRQAIPTLDIVLDSTFAAPRNERRASSSALPGHGGAARVAAGGLRSFAKFSLTLRLQGIYLSLVQYRSRHPPTFRVTQDVILEQCKGVHCVDLGESFPTSIFLQNLASIQRKTSPEKFAGQ